jgi:choline dehydrogenase-like flavoprotein
VSAAREVVVVGSGASAVHFARTVLDQGWRVTMLDVGREKPPAVNPDDSFTELKERLEDPLEYFLGRGFEGVLFPGNAGEYYGIPPSKEYVFRGVDSFRVRSRGFEPLSSFGQGGLAEAWTGGSFPFNAAELADWPFEASELEPFYGRVAGRIGVSGADDDLSRFTPVHEHLAPPLDLDQHSRLLLEKYADRRERLNRDLKIWIGRTRTATIDEETAAKLQRQGCTYLGRCLWSCPREALYTPSLTLRELRSHDAFTYVPGLFVTHLEVDGANRVRGVRARELTSGAERAFEAERVALGAGTLCSSKIFLDTLRRHGGQAPVLGGLMDNRQVLLPFVNLGMLREPWEERRYQYHQLALGLERSPARQYVHGLITTLKTALIHPVVQSVPMDLLSSLTIFRNVHAALGILNVNFHDDRREENTLALEPAGGADDATRLVVTYSPSADEPARVKSALSTLKKALRQLGCVVPPGMAHVRPMGASVHYAGSLPMRAERAPRTTSPLGESHDLEGLYFVDGTTLPFLPAKNLTFTLMAGATRIAALAFV